MKTNQVNQTLTNFASGIAQDTASALARFICPIVPTGVTNGQYKKFSDKNAFQLHDTSRALGGPRKRIEFNAEDPTFNCKPQALEIPIDDHERDGAGDMQSRMEEAKIRTLVIAANLSHEKKVFDLIRAGKAATAGLGEWSNAAKDPIAELDSEIEAIATETGMMPNRFVLGLGAWRVLKNHPKVLSRQPGSSNQGVTLEQLAGMLLNPAIEIRIGVLSRDTAKFGTGKTATNIVGAESFIFYGSDAADVYDPSFAKCFTTTPSLVNSVRQYRDEKAASDVHYLDWSEDIQVVSPICGRRITLS